MEKAEINQNESEIPEEILKSIADHYTRIFQSNTTVLIVDLEGPQEVYDIISENLSSFLSKYFYEDFVEINQDQDLDLIDLAARYPEQRIFILSTMQHLKKHDLEQLETEFYRHKKEKIKRYESAFKYYNSNFVAINLSSGPDVIGLEFHSCTLTHEDAMREITEIVATPLMLDVDKIESANGVYSYAKFKKYWIIYGNQPKLKYKYITLTNEKEENETIVEVEWLLFAEISTKFLSDLFYL